MSQVYGFPGGGFKNGRLRFLTGVGDPNTSATEDVKGAKLGDNFIREDFPDLSHYEYVCTTAAVFTNGTLVANAAWTAK